MLLSQYLYPIILFFVELATKEKRKIDLGMDFSQFSYSYTCLIVLVILFFITSKKEIHILLKINTFGVIFTIIIITSILIAGIYGLVTGNYEITIYYDNAKDRPKAIEEDSTVLLLFGS